MRADTNQNKLHNLYRAAALSGPLLGKQERKRPHIKRFTRWCLCALRTKHKVGLYSLEGKELPHFVETEVNILHHKKIDLKNPAGHK